MLRSSFVAGALRRRSSSRSPGAAGGQVTSQQTVTRKATTAAFPVTIVTAAGKVTIQRRPARIVSLSPTATESLFAIGAGPQVVAVDDQSDYPKAAPRTALSGFTPNVEAIAAYRPDLVVASYDPKGLVSALGRLGIPVVLHGPASNFKGAYQQIRQLGMVTGREHGCGTCHCRHEGEDRRDSQDLAIPCRRPLRLPRGQPRLLLGIDAVVRREGVRGTRPREHRRRRRLRRDGIPAALRRIHRLGRP